MYIEHTDVMFKKERERNNKPIFFETATKTNKVKS